MGPHFQQNGQYAVSEYVWSTQKLVQLLFPDVPPEDESQHTHYA